MATISLLDHFSALRDPRQSWKVIYPLAEVLLIVLCGTLAGAGDFVEIRGVGAREDRFPEAFHALRARCAVA
ncbi:DDE family transposase [Ciceribacter lividus]|uniref:DDE family transposase n=1 Tax=Ciceribacter lividus TaxID=1197950 RepID=A0A6I7HHW9_9HYPH|nr:DDE family transposase [Ciceribacter lividus]